MSKKPRKVPFAYMAPANRHTALTPAKPGRYAPEGFPEPKGRFRTANVVQSPGFGDPAHAPARNEAAHERMRDRDIRRSEGVGNTVRALDYRQPPLPTRPGEK